MTSTLKHFKILVAKPGLDGHDVGAKVLCRYLMDAGAEVVYTGLRKSPAEIAHAAIEEDVQAIGLSILSGAHLALCEKLARELASQKVSDIILMVGGNVPNKDVEALHALGIHKAFPTGSHPEEVIEYLKALKSQVKQ